MAIYHFSVRIVSRGKGQSAVAVAARRAAERLYDRRCGLHVRPDDGSRPMLSAIMLPADAPAWMSGREELWNAVEAAENRLDAQLARELELALPIELENEQAIALAREFVQQEFIQHGMIADHARSHRSRFRTQGPGMEPGRLAARVAGALGRPDQRVSAPHRSRGADRSSPQARSGGGSASGQGGQRNAAARSGA